jgi:hypothetical protein
MSGNGNANAAAKKAAANAEIMAEKKRLENAHPYDDVELVMNGNGNPSGFRVVTNPQKMRNALVAKYPGKTISYVLNDNGNVTGYSVFDGGKRKTRRGRKSGKKSRKTRGRGRK